MTFFTKFLDSWSRFEILNWKHTEWKFHDFSVIQILREINFGDCTSAKSAILSYFKALDEFLFLWIFAFFKVECSFDTIQRLKNGKKTAVLRNYYILQNWFHVKSEGQKNPEFSTLWYKDLNLNNPLKNH